MSEYPDRPSRIDSIYDAMVRRKIGEFLDPVNHGIEPILAVHSKKYIDYLENAYPEWIKRGGDENGVIPDTFGVNLDQITREICLKSDNIMSTMGLFSFDTAAVIAEKTYRAAYVAAQLALTAADHLIDDQRDCTYALCRPPGHHASSEQLAGFCFLNNVAIAAEHLIKHHNKRVAILDIDYHHGNGTQAIFYERENPLFISLHDSEDYPYYWGKVGEDGKGEGKGFNVNVPLPSGTGDKVYLDELERVIRDTIVPYNPDVLVVSLGVDTFELDPVGTFKLTSDCFTKIGALLKTVERPVLFVQEGGYDSKELGDNVCNVFEGFLTR